MKNLFSFILVLFTVLLLAGSANAQLSGTKTIPGDYATISAAVTALNSAGVGAGGVTFNVAAGHTENTTAEILITATGTSGNQIVFQKSGVGVNPKITRTDANVNTTTVLGALGDAVIRMNSTDYITFDGIDVAATQSTIEYGYFTFKTATNGCKYVTIKNCNITMTKGAYVIGINISNGPTSTSSATGVTVTTEPGANNNIIITGNTIQNVHAGIYLRGATGYYDYNYTIGTSGAGNTITNFGGGSATTTYGVYFIYVSTASVDYNTINNASGGSDHASTLYGIFLSTVNGVISASNNGITLSTSGTSAMHWIYNGNACTSENYSNNTFAAGGFTSTSTAYIIYSSNATNGKTISGNQTSGAINKTSASGSIYCYYNAGTPTGGTETISNNNFSNISVTGTSALYGIYSSSATAQNRVCNNNTISNLTGGTGACYPLYLLSSLSNQINNNSVSNVTTGGLFYGLYFSGTNPTVYENTIYNVTSSGTTYVIYNAGTGTTLLYRNKVSNITNNSTTAALYGIYATTGTSNNIYNNYVSELYAPNLSSTTINLTGIYISAGTAMGVFYNTVYLDATGTGANFGSSALYASTTPSVELRNNILINNSTPNGSGIAAAYRRSSTTIGTYSANSNNNDFYAGTPGANNLIFYDGTTSYQTITDFKNLVSPIDNASFTELPPFVNVAAMPYDLHIGTVPQTQCESGGSVVSTEASVSITNDYDNHARYPNPGYPDDILHPATAPDVGADEFAGNPKDLIGPSITYTPLGNTSSTGARTLTAEITDPSGVPTSGAGLPVLYWRINAGAWTGATATSLGGNQYQFSFGSGASSSNIIQYYICSQDLLNNVSAYPSAGAGGFSASPPSASTPPTTPSSYQIVGSLAGGDYLIGGSGSTPAPGCTYVDLTAAFADINQVVLSIDIINGGSGYTTAPTVTITGGGGSGATATATITGDAVTSVTITNMGTGYTSPPTVTFTGGGGADADASANISPGREITGAVNFILTSNYSSSEENLFPIVINPVTGASATNTVTVKPNTGVTPTITGLSAAIIKFAGADYIIFDGSNSGGTDRSLTIENTNSTTNTVVFWNSSLGAGMGASGNTIKNCNILGGANTISSMIGVFSAGTTIGTTGTGEDNDNLTIQNNSISKCAYGAYARGTTLNPIEGLLIKQNSIGSNIPANYVAAYGINVQAAAGMIVSENEIFNMIFDGSKYGIYLGTYVSNSFFSKNKIHTFNQSNTTTTYYSTGIYFSSATGNSNNQIDNNSIYDLQTYGNTSTLYNSGIRLIGGDGYKIYYNSISHTGAYVNTTAGLSSICLNISTLATNIDMRNNIFYNAKSGTNPNSYTIYAVTGTTFTNLNYNDYYTTGAAFGYYGAEVADYAAWVTASGEGINSKNVNPQFNSNTNLQPLIGSPVLAQGTPISGISTDITGFTRSGTVPSMGAYENGVDATGPTIEYTALVNTAQTTDRTLTATITDVSGVPVAGDGLPRLYWKINAGSYSSVQSVSIGSNQYTFTFGSGVATGNVISYYICAQDMLGTPFVSCYPTGGESGFSSSPPAVSTPPTTPSTYTIVPAMSGTLAVGTGGDYPSLTGAGGLFSFINTNAVTGNLTINIVSDITEDGTNALNQWLEEGVGGYTLTIQPDGTTERLLSGDVANGMIRLNGADRVTFDGRFSGAGRYLRFRNTNTLNPTFTFINDAVNNTIQYCNVEGSSTSTSNGIIFFSTGSTSGNDNNTITQNIIRDRSDALAVPYYAIYSAGTAGAMKPDLIPDRKSEYLSNRSANNKVKSARLKGDLTNNGALLTTDVAEDISDAPLKPDEIKLYGPDAIVNNSGNIITNNEIFNFRSYGVYVTSTGNGDGWNISNNSFYNNLGTPPSVTQTVIYFIPGTNSSGNTISGNFIGGSSPNCGGTPWTNSGAVAYYGMNIAVGSTTATTVSNNTISNISQTSTGAASFRGIYVTAGEVNISTNTIGHATNPNSVQNAGTSLVYGIQTNDALINITNNEIANLTAGTGSIFGIYRGYTTTSIDACTVNNNNIHDLTTQSVSVTLSTAMAACGIVYFPNTYMVNDVVSGNTIYNIHAANNTAISSGSAGMLTSNNSAKITGNKIYNIINSSTQTTLTAPPIAAGIINRFSSNNLFANNLISLGVSQTTNTQFNGIMLPANNTGSFNAVYNTIYIGGTIAAGDIPSFGFLRGDNTGTANQIAVNIGNNFFYNERTGGTAKQYALANQCTILDATGWGANASNYNMLVTPNSAVVNLWGPTEYNFADWKTNSLCDNNSSNILNTSVPSANMFTSVSTGDLSIKTGETICWFINGEGYPLTAVNNDFAGNPRSTTAVNGPTDLGAYEFTPSVAPSPATPSGFPAVSTTTTYSQNNLQLGSITWGPGGTPPSSISFLLYTGTQPTGGGAVPKAYMYWNITPTGGDGYSYDIILYYDENELGGIPENKLHPAKSSDNGVTWQAFLTEGTGPGQFQRDMVNNTITIYGLTSFSWFGLGNSDTPLPVTLSSFTSSVNNRDVKLAWQTESEINNAGFDVERSLSGLNQWVKAGYLAGKGNSNSPVNYTFEDKKLNSGKYNYRLKQIDNNGNFEYYALSNVVEVGIPTKFDISQNYPNPFNPTTKIDFSLPFDSKVSIKLYDITGREVKTLVNDARTAGYYTVQFNASDLSSGTYFYRIMTKSSGADYIMTKKMVLVK